MSKPVGIFILSVYESFLFKILIQYGIRIPIIISYALLFRSPYIKLHTLIGTLFYGRYLLIKNFYDVLITFISNPMYFYNQWSVHMYVYCQSFKSYTTIAAHLLHKFPLESLRQLTNLYPPPPSQEIPYFLFHFPLHERIFTHRPFVE